MHNDRYYNLSEVKKLLDEKIKSEKKPSLKDRAKQFVGRFSITKSNKDEAPETN